MSAVPRRCMGHHLSTGIILWKQEPSNQSLQWKFSAAFWALSVNSLKETGSRACHQWQGTQRSWSWLISSSYKAHRQLQNHSSLILTSQSSPTYQVSEGGAAAAEKTAQWRKGLMHRHDLSLDLWHPHRSLTGSTSRKTHDIYLWPPHTHRPAHIKKD